MKVSGRMKPVVKDFLIEFVLPIILILLFSCFMLNSCVSDNKRDLNNKRNNCIRHKTFEWPSEKVKESCLEQFPELSEDSK